MSAETPRRSLLHTLIIAGVAALAVVGFVEVGLYAKARSAAASLVRGGERESAAPVQRPRSADLRDSTTFLVLERRTQEILEARDTELGVERQRELMLLWHELRIWQNLWYLGIRIQKNPMDTWMTQQIMYEVQPDYVIEAGTAYGGSALLWAHILDGLGLEDSRVITIDITDYNQQASAQPLWKKYVQFIEGSSTDPEVVSEIARMVEGKKVLVMLDSSHAGPHVLDELMAYGPMVSPGSYIIVEDTNLDGLPVPFELRHLEGTGPMWAVTQYLDGEGGELFETDLTRENFVLTFNPGGWLKRKATAEPAAM